MTATNAIPARYAVARNRMRYQKSEQSFSLLEVLIFVTILSLFFVAALTVTIASLRSTKVNENKLIAKHYAQELYDWLRTQKELNWGGTCFYSPAEAGTVPSCYSPTENENTFTIRASTFPREYCFQTSPITSWPSILGSLDNCPYTVGGGFQRYVKFTLVTNENQAYIDKVKASIVVKWVDAGTVYETPIDTVFSIWENSSNQDDD